MTAWQRIPLVCTSFVLAAFTTGSHAAEKINLERVTPVPATEPIPIQDFFRPLLLQQPSLNLSGSHIAALFTAGEDRHQLLVYDLKTQKSESIGGPGDKDIYYFAWLNDRRLIFELSARKLYGLGLFVADVGAIDAATPLLQYYGSHLISVPTKNRLRPLVWNSYESIETGKDQGVATVNTDIHTGQFIDLLAAGNRNGSAVMDARDNNEKHILARYPVPEPGLTYGYETDKEGELEFAFTSQDGQLAMLHLADGHWNKCPVDLEHIDIIGSGETPGQLVVLGPRQDGKPRAMQFMDGVTGQLGEVLLQDKAYDFYGWLYRDPVTRNIVGAVYQRNGPKVVWFDKGYAQLQKILDGFFPGLVVHIIGNDEGGKIFLVATFSDRQPVIYNWVNLETHKIGLIKNSRPWIDPARMQPMNMVKFKTRDGRQLDAYVTLPAGASKANPPPLVVLPHGGPWVRDDWGFDGAVQFLASRGYAVMQPNYRGSPGYSWMFPEEDEWDFLKMHDDVTDATKALIASGMVDGNRVAIMGGSFGGYLALSGVVHEPALYRCAVTIAGVFDWTQQVHDKKFNRYDNPTFGRLMRKLGDPETQREKFASISPERQVAQIRVPVFVAHGKDDPVVDISQSRQLISALEKNHVPHDSFLVGEEGHGMGHLDNQVELYSRIEAFLAKNLAPVKNVAVAATEASKN